MMRRRIVIIGSVFFSGSALAVDLTSADLDPRPVDGPPAEVRILPFSGIVPACDDPATLTRIFDDFNSRENSPLGSGLAIVSFDAVRETGYRSNGLSYIPRRYCWAHATLTDGKRHGVGYEIAENQGFIGWGYGVQWCVVGFDRYHAFSPSCKATQP